MMKKTLIALAVLSSMATSAMATQVTLYGKVDVGLAFTSVDNGKDSGRHNVLKELSGQTAGSRWGMKGIEDLGGGNQVGFILESGFNTDSGSSAQGGRLFGREAAVFVQGRLGKLMLGRMGSFASGFPDTGLFGGNMSPFAVCFGEVPGHRFVFSGNFSPLDNAITYITPSFNGWKLHAQYSFDRNSLNSDTQEGDEGKNAKDRFWSVAVSYNDAKTEFNVAIDQTKYSKVYDASSSGDSFTVSAGLRHKFEPLTLYVGGQYFKDMRDFTVGEYQGLGWLTNAKKYGNKDGFGAYVGTDIPAWGGLIKAYIGYMHAEGSKDSDQELKRMNASLGYWYNLSKRTVLWGGVGYTHDKLKGVDSSYGTANAIGAGLGIVHNF